MAPIFILTRAFVLSAFLVGAFNTVRGVPLPMQMHEDKRFMGACRYGCLLAEPEPSTPPASIPPVPVSSSVPAIIEIMKAVAPSPPPSPSQPASLHTHPDPNDVDDDLPNALLRFTGGEEESGKTAPVVVEVIDLDVPAAASSVGGSALDDVVAAIPELLSAGTQPTSPEIP